MSDQILPVKTASAVHQLEEAEANQEQENENENSKEQEKEDYENHEETQEPQTGAIDEEEAEPEGIAYQKIIAQRVKEIALELPEEKVELINKFLEDVEGPLFTSTGHFLAGGLLSVCVDPVTYEGFFLFGVEKMRKKIECEDDRKELFYDEFKNGKRKTFVRNVLCHFHGYIDALETFCQGSAREAYEESHGLLGNQVDLWRCTMLKGEFSYRVEGLSSMGIISLGFLNSQQRQALIQKFHTLEVVSPPMAEMFDVKFVSIQKLHQELQRIQIYSICSFIDPPQTVFPRQCNFTNIDPTEFQPNHAYWLRSFLLEWLTKSANSKTIRSEIRKEQDRDLQLVAELPKVIQLPLFPVGFAHSLREISLEILRDGKPKLFWPCLICNCCILSCAYYAHVNEETQKICDRVHIHCALKSINPHEKGISQNESESIASPTPLTWRVKTREEIIEDVPGLLFFESDFIKFLTDPTNYQQNPELLHRNEIYPGLKSIDQLPVIDDLVRSALERAMQVREEYLEEEESSYKRKPFVKLSCKYCQKTFFRPEGKKTPSCLPCLIVSQEIARRSQERDQTNKNPKNNKGSKQSSPNDSKKSIPTEVSKKGDSSKKKFEAPSVAKKSGSSNSKSQRKPSKSGDIKKKTTFFAGLNEESESESD